MASVSFQYLPEDFLDAWRLQMRHNRIVRFSRWMPLFLVAFSFLVSWAEIRDQGVLYGVLLNLPMMALAGLLLGLNVLNNKVLLPRRARRFLAQQKSLQGEATISWDSEGMSFAIANGHTRVAWVDYVRWLEGDKLLLLFQSDHLFNALPKRLFNDGQAAEIRDYLTAAVGKVGKTRK